MNWLAVATIAYFLIALGVILDKFLLASKRVSHPAIYTFYSGILSLAAFLFFPFGFHAVGLAQFFLSFLAGIIFIAGMLGLFFALSRNEASRVVPAIGAVIPVVTYFISIFVLEERLTYGQISGSLILVFGGLLISLNISELKKSGSQKFFSGFFPSILAGVFLGAAYAIFKSLFEQDNFVNVYIWTRFGILAGAVALLVNPRWRRLILNSLKNFRKPQKEQRRSGLLFIFNKGLNGIGSILINFAISLGSVTLVNALISIEYVFVFVFGLIFSHWLPGIFREGKNFGAVIQKILAIVIITAGVILIS